MPILLTSKMATSDCSRDLITSMQYLYRFYPKQVDILISKTRHCKYYILNIVYIIMKPHKLPWIRNLQNPRKFNLN